MTLIEALEILKGKGINNLVGMCDRTNIDEYIDNAREGDEIAADVLSRYPDMSWAIYHAEHVDAHFIVETADGHHIIATHYDNFDMATYSDYDTQDEMYAAFDEWKIMRDAEKIADEMTATRPDELPRAAWILIVTSELRAAHVAAMEAFDREFPPCN